MNDFKQECKNCGFAIDEFDDGCKECGYSVEYQRSFDLEKFKSLVNLNKSKSTDKGFDLNNDLPTKIQEFQVLSGMDTTMDITNQRVLVFELGVVTRKSIGNPDMGLEQYSASLTNLTKYIVAHESSLGMYILENFQNGSFVKLNLNEFSAQKHGAETVYFHLSVPTKIEFL
ncbi:hypothetical protein DHD32_18370 [Arenibacter sp. TNZ]|uniref:hypothetical protein n=1 Tax=Arenibacter TaxID=178469 RepID=UPI000CD44E46|nr:MULTISPECIES: hypothetical protein [Arenibacter]MCM4173446.1 hypothetical protein [Arenibacter sp. TNZ]